MSVSLPKRSHSLARSKQRIEPSRLIRSTSLSYSENSRSKRIAQESIKEQLLPPVPIIFQEPESYHSLEPITPPTRSSSLTQIKPEEEIRLSILDWKHKSTFRFESLFSPVSLWNEHRLIFGTIENDYQQQVERKAGSLWEEQCISKREIASYLGRRDPFCHKVLVCYLKYFDFTGLHLVDAFRKLCSKLYFKAEAQEIDRILEAFACQYWDTHQDDSLYKCADVVYTMTYSIMLLNTDLHLVQISHHQKMNCQTFCNNTLATLLEQKIPIQQDAVSIEMWKYDITERLKTIYFSIQSQGILQPASENQAKTFLKKVGSIRRKKKETEQ